MNMHIIKKKDYEPGSWPTAGDAAAKTIAANKSKSAIVGSRK